MDQREKNMYFYLILIIDDTSSSDEELLELMPLTVGKKGKTKTPCVGKRLFSEPEKNGTRKLVNCQLLIFLSNNCLSSHFHNRSSTVKNEQ